MVGAHARVSYIDYLHMCGVDKAQTGTTLQGNFRMISRQLSQDIRDTLGYVWNTLEMAWNTLLCSLKDLMYVRQWESHI